MNTRKTITCRSCGGINRSRFSLGNLYPSSFADSPTPPLWPKVPLSLAECETCGLVQLEDSFSPDSMYRQYWYQSSLNASMVDALEDVAFCAAQECRLSDGDTVVDIGCNDGTLLACYSEKLGIKAFRIGVDPCVNLAGKASSHCELFLNEYFGTSKPVRKARLITAVAMFYDLEDVSAFMRSVKEWLLEDGIFVIQMTDLLSMMEQNAFDNICHEHLEYWSLKSLIYLMHSQDMEVFRITTNRVNGGSIRAFCCRPGVRRMEDSVKEYLARESPWVEFGWRSFEINARRTLSAVRSFILAAVHGGKTVSAIGASTKGNTLLQLLDLPMGHIREIAEVNPDKFGKFTVGTGIPIRPEYEVLFRNPDYILVLPWHFIEDFKSRLAGRNILWPMPIPKINDEVLW